MKTFRVCLLTFLFFYVNRVQSQDLKHHFLGNLNVGGQFSNQIADKFNLNADINYFLTNHLNIGVLSNLNHTISPTEKLISNRWGAELRYYFAKKPTSLLFFHTAYFQEQTNWTFSILNHNRTDLIKVEQLNTGLGANFKIRPNILFESTLNFSLTKWQYFFFSEELVNEKNYFSLYSNFKFKALLPHSKNEYQKYRIIYFDKEDRFININSYLRFFGDTGQAPFALDISFSLGVFRNNNWMWGLDSRLGYFEFRGKEGVHLSIHPYIRYYFSVYSKRIRPFVMAQIEINHHFDGDGQAPITGPIALAGLNYFISPVIALDLTLGAGTLYEGFRKSGSHFSPNLSMKYFL